MLVDIYVLWNIAAAGIVYNAVNGNLDYNYYAPVSVMAQGRPSGAKGQTIGIYWPTRAID